MIAGFHERPRLESIGVYVPKIQQSGVVEAVAFDAKNGSASEAAATGVTVTSIDDHGTGTDTGSSVETGSGKGGNGGKGTSTSVGGSGATGTSVATGPDVTDASGKKPKQP